MKEVWRVIKGYEGLYAVSNLGNVKALEVVRVCPTKTMSMKEKLLKQSKHRQGYLCVGLSKDGVRKGFMVHRLGALAFIENPKKLLEVNHKDGVKSNNLSSNLEWVSRIDNQRHAIKTGLWVGLKGQQHGSSILNEKQVIKIRELCESKVLHKDIAAMFGVSPSTVCSIVKGRCWSHI